MEMKSLTKSYINGAWVDGEGSSTYKLLNPYDSSVLAEFPIASKEQMEQAYQVGDASYKEWAKDANVRAEVLKKATNFFKENEEEIAEMLALESGSTYVKAKVEIALTVACFEESLKYVDSLGFREVPETMPGKVNKVYRKPLGVVSSISPFNFPLYLSVRTIIPALALGNAVVHKGDIQTAVTGGTIIAKAFEEAGLPKGVFNVVLTEIPEIGNMMIEHPLAKFISFTGSTPVGKSIGRTAGELLKPVALELGGNAPFVVLEDADVDQAVKAAIFGKFLHQGQICMMINRIVVHEKLYDEFAEKFVKHAQTLTIGDPLDKSVIIGPMINEQQLQKAESFIAQAKEDGYEVLLDGKREGNILTPAIFGNVPPDSALAQTEVFSPIVPLIKVASDEEALEVANSTEFGLSSAIFTEDLAKGEKLATEFEFGMTHVNDQTVNAIENTPFGGVKGSGMGRFGNPWVVEEFTETQWISLQEVPREYPF